MSKPDWIPWEETAGPDWDAFVEVQPHGRFIHLTGFKKTVEDVYGLQANYWLFRDEGAIRAVFPSFFHRGFVTGRKLVSQPFSEYGGILFATDAEPAERRAILSGLPRVIEQSRERGRLAYLEIRGFPDLAEDEKGMFQEIRMCERAVLPLDPGLRLWDSVDYSVRKNVRRARSSGLELRVLQTPEDIRRIFYPLHLRSLKRLGSPPHPLAYFLRNHENLADRMRLLTAWLGGRPVGALLGWVVGRSVQITDIASDERYFALPGPRPAPFRAHRLGRGPGLPPVRFRAGEIRRAKAVQKEMGRRAPRLFALLLPGPAGESAALRPDFAGASGAVSLATCSQRTGRQVRTPAAAGAGHMMSFAELVAVLRCLACAGPLRTGGPGLVCPGCGRAYPSSRVSPS